MLKAQDVGVREIARRLGRHPSTISRELRRNAATRGSRLDYRASIAQWKAELMARRPKTAKLVANERLREYVQDRLAGVIRTADGTVVPGPIAPQWKGRNTGSFASTSPRAPTCPDGVLKRSRQSPQR